MAKFVCDFDEVRKAGQNLSKTAGEMETSIKTYGTTIESDLAGWESSSKNAYINANNMQIKSAEQVNKYAENLSKYIVDAANKIEECENKLSQIDI